MHHFVPSRTIQSNNSSTSIRTPITTLQGMQSSLDIYPIHRGWHSDPQLVLSSQETQFASYHPELVVPPKMPRSPCLALPEFQELEDDFGNSFSQQAGSSHYQSHCFSPSNDVDMNLDFDVDIDDELHLISFPCPDWHAVDMTQVHPQRRSPMKRQRDEDPIETSASKRLKGQETGKHPTRHQSQPRQGPQRNASRPQHWKAR